MGDLLKKPGAWLPIAMSLAALAWTVGYIAMVGISRVRATHDEELGARVFQLLMGGQLPVILYFVVRRLPQKPKPAFIVLILQILAMVLAFTPVYILEL